MKLPRITTRRLMLAVALVGLGLGSIAELHRRSVAFDRLSKYHILTAGNLHPPRRHGPIPRADWHARMGAKYRAAAERPWLPVEADPPEPTP
jgi:hypothetical protein